MDFTEDGHQVLQWGDGAISELCFDGSDDLGMEDEDAYDPRDSLDESDNEGTQNTKNYLFHKLMQLLQNS